MVILHYVADYNNPDYLTDEFYPSHHFFASVIRCIRLRHILEQPALRGPHLDLSRWGDGQTGVPDLPSFPEECAKPRFPCTLGA